jgi:arylsulfatase A-like enzyme
MHRRLRIPFVALATLAPVLGALVQASAQTQPRPNILLIVTDDQRAGTLGVMPHTTERFVRSGTRFSRAFTTTPLCCPSRVTMFTGRYAHNHGIFSNREDPQTLASRQDSMVQRRLHDAGYRTGLVGKFVNNWPNDRNPANFDRWVTTPFTTFSGGEWNVNGSLQVIDQNSTTFIGRRTVGFLRSSEQADAAPWFLQVGFMAPHFPATVEPRYQDVPIPPLRLNAGMREADRRDKPPYVQARRVAKKNVIEGRRARQLRSLVAVDDQVRRIMSTIDQLGETENTLAIFVSDNGYLWGEHGLFAKSTPYLQSARIPMFMTWPGALARGATDDRLSGIIDIAPTILSAAGLQPPSELDGMDLLDPASARNRLLLEFRQVDLIPVPTWSAVLTKRHSFVEYVNEAGGVTFREFYRLRSDPQQLVNVLADGDRDNDPNVARLSSLLRDLRACSGTSCPR